MVKLTDLSNQSDIQTVPHLQSINNLKEQKQRIEQQLKMEASQKSQAERELFHLRDAVSKIKQERCVQSDPYAAIKDFKAPLWQENKLLFV